MSREAKEEGNRLFQDKDYESAILKYQKAIKLLPKFHIDVSYLRSNIAECYIQMGITEYPKAIIECSLSLQISHKHNKALLKRARCYEALENYDLAEVDVCQVLQMEPRNVMALELYERVKKGKCRNADGSTRNVKLVYGEEIRWAQISTTNCNILKLREIISEKFPKSKAIHVKYKDQEGDLVTITTNQELNWAETGGEGDQASIKLYIVEVNPDQDPLYYQLTKTECKKHENCAVKEPTSIDDWIIQFAQIFKNYVGLNSDTYLDIHKLGMKLYSEAMEESVADEEAQSLFNTAAEKFQEMAALALFNWGNVHMSRAKKRLYITEDASKETVVLKVSAAYELARSEYLQAGDRYEESLKIKPDFYEAVLALGQQQFEQAKLSWYYAVGNNANLETWPSSEALELYNNAEGNMEKGMQMWETYEESKPSKVKLGMQKMGLDRIFKDLSEDETLEQSSNMRSQINLLWGTMLYERSIMEFKLELPVWQECLEVAVEKFELAGASETDIHLIMKNHCSNESAVEGMSFNIDEIVQAWNEMYEAKRWESGVRSFRLEPVLRRRVSKLCHDLEYV
ncbi:protein PHOX1-like [Impatiens glandulifera]|uniref:protein PHOX1-like n=1 Tax=Impatiens glandulifera TaxID=253017 RepID=UPI001FB0624F|nr:protein PHOX1-like [Impatiens glandulifera]